MNSQKLKSQRFLFEVGCSGFCGNEDYFIENVSL